MSIALTVALSGVLLASVLMIPVLAWMFFRAEAGPARWLLLVFAALVVENTWTMFFRVRKGNLPKPIPNLSMALVGYAYASVFYVSLWDFYLHGTPWPPPWCGLAGLVFLAAGKAMHYWATHHLATHSSKAPGDASAGVPQSLVCSGPYATIRHPMYTAACLESLGVPLLLGSWWGLAFAALVFVPLEYHRAVTEEKVLHGRFAGPYAVYMSCTARLFAWPFVCRKDEESPHD